MKCPVFFFRKRTREISGSSSDETGLFYVGLRSDQQQEGAHIQNASFQFRDSAEGTKPVTALLSRNTLRNVTQGFQLRPVLSINTEY